jgi:hypothetical protein
MKNPRFPSEWFGGKASKGQGWGDVPEVVV